jgi:hypothetical protein
MKNLRKTVVFALLVVVILVAAVAPAAARKVNEYEGQHRIAAEGDPSQWSLVGDPSQW